MRRGSDFKMVDLSIIIPHYNSITTLKKLLISIPIKRNVEVIVIDDRSTEDIEEFNHLSSCNKFKHVTFLENRTLSKGAGVCRNIGLSKSVGNWILFADADDFFVERFYGKISKYFNSRYDVVFFKPTSIEIDTGHKSDRHLNYEKLLLNYSRTKSIEDETLLRYQFYVPWSKLIHRDILMNNGISFDDVIASNDVMFSTKLGHYMDEFKVSHDVIYCVTRGLGTLTTNINIDVFDSRTKVHIKYCEFLKNNLDRKRFKIIHPNGTGIIFNAFKLKLGFKKIISILFQLKKSRVTVLDLRLFNPIFIVRRLIHHNKKHSQKKKYFVNRQR